MKYKLSGQFLEIKRVTGHPDANNIFSSLMEVINPDQSDSKLPLHRLAGFTTDGASVLISPKARSIRETKKHSKSKIIFHSPQISFSFKGRTKRVT